MRYTLTSMKVFTLHQTKSTTGPKAGPSPLTPLMREILPAASHSPALCQSIVAASAVWHASYRGHLEPDTRILSLHGQAIQTFREELSNSATAYSNATLLAAACLTHLQVLCRSRSGLKTHVDGIQSIVNARGGLHNVGWVAHIILWIDYYTCLYVNQEPRFTWPMDDSIRLSTNLDPIYGSAFESPELEMLLDPDLRQLCIEVCRTVELLESTTGKGSAKSVQDYYRYKRTTMCIQLGRLHAKFHTQATINECVSLTVNILVLKMFFMHVLDESRMDLCSKLRVALEFTSVKFLQREHIDLLTWILFTAGAVAPTQSPWKGWFINSLKAVLTAPFSRLPDACFLELYLRGYISKVLRSHVWSQKLLTHVFETTLGSITPSAKKPLHSEKKMASVNGLFPG